MKQIILLIFTLNVFPSFANIPLVDYGEDNLVVDKEQRSLYLRAIALNLKTQSLDSCEGEYHQWKLVSEILRPEESTDLYKLENKKKMFVLRYFSMKYFSEAPSLVVDFIFEVDEDKKQIVQIQNETYELLSHQYNSGTLVEPVLIDHPTVRHLYSQLCI